MDEFAATTLFETVDRALGIFRFEAMDEEQWRYWAIMREQFLTLYQEAVPAFFWFQNETCASLLLAYCEASSLFSVAASPVDALEGEKVAALNRSLRALSESFVAHGLLTQVS